MNHARILLAWFASMFVIWFMWLVISIGLVKTLTLIGCSLLLGLTLWGVPKLYDCFMRWVGYR
jgi:hypothetical protein